MSYPTLTVAIPTYNEADAIARVIAGFLNSNYPNLIEILVADGGSTDNTISIVQELAERDSRVKLILNPDKLQTYALNLMIAAAQGEMFLRADAHCDYASDYIEKCVATFLETKAMNVGGAQRFVAKNSFQTGIALATRSFLGSGGAKYRDSNYNGFADTVFLGCFWLKDLQSLGGYSLDSTTNEDAELNFRLKQLATNSIYISSDIKVWYYPRKTWQSLWIQYFRYGRGRYLTTIKHPERSQLRGKLPFILVFTMIILLCCDLFLVPFNLYVRELFICGLVAIFLESLRINLKLRSQFITEIWRGNSESIPSFLSRWINCAIVMITMPLAHFSGYGYQLFSHNLLKRLRPYFFLRHQS